MDHGKHMFVCVGIAAVAIAVLTASGLSIGYALLFLVPCMLMMAAMMWMMDGGDSGRTDR